ncbi:HU family DNA-binding protein [Paraburkholderia sp. MM5384-R2]|uniref:HU family DNA-binding protein n=1 Tax=Paraburkholderia sp. MM5384-R2 TaxID=2723097 RepID=UPI0021A522B5|nr:HU family DNA-binding protein [Paraburkholderia sp. MM5384-R2]
MKGRIVVGDTVQLIRFSSFSAGARPPQVARNPATGADIQIPAAKTAELTAANAFTAAVRGT